MYKIKFGFLLVVLSFLCSTNGFTQDSQKRKVLSLEDVISIAREKSYIAQAAKHSYRSSYWEHESYKAMFLPYLEADLELPTFKNSDSWIPQPDGTEKLSNVHSIRASGELSLVQRIGLTNGLISINSSLDSYKNLSNDKLDDTDSQLFMSSPLFLRYTQTLFGYNNLKWMRKISPVKFQKAERVYKQSMEEVAIKSVDVFFDLLIAEKSIKINRTNMMNYDTLYKIAKGRYNLGKIAENDLLQLELNYMQAKKGFESAKIGYDNSLFRFKSFLRMKDSDTIVLIPPTPKSFFNVSVDEAINLAYTNSPEILAFKERELTAKSKLAEAKYAKRFDININATYGVSASNTEFTEVYKNFNKSQTASVGFSIPILDWGNAKGRIRMAKSNLDLTLEQVAQSKVDFEMDIINKVNEFNIQELQYTIAAKADTIAQKRYDVTQKRYLIGKVNDILDLTNAQKENDNTKNDYYRSLQSYWQQYYTIRKITLYDFEQDKSISVNLNEIK
ncbi:MAG: TolC family protein [Hyphomicrobiales bacterium]